MHACASAAEHRTPSQLEGNGVVWPVTSSAAGSKLVYLGGLAGGSGSEARELSSLQLPSLTWDAATGHRALLQGHGAVATSRTKLLTFG